MKGGNGSFGVTIPSEQMSSCIVNWPFNSSVANTEYINGKKNFARRTCKGDSSGCV